ncbi:hypothetical protein HDU76_009023 [Blyttiomyces sp. JEL0837]|nr:hypothetical protein HDU76_009023 [Blyttiomyces sp. JEL0837]
MVSFTFLASLATLAVSMVSAAPTANQVRDFCLKYNTQDCRNFDLYQVKSEEIEKHIKIGTSANVAPGVPSYLHGVFYMEGNPLSDEVLSAADGIWHEAEKAYYIRVYDENNWSWDDSFSGRLLYDAVRTFGLTYKLTWDSSNVTFVEPKFYLPAYVGNEKLTITDMFANFTIIPTADPNFFIRRSSFLTKPVADYQFIKIVDGNGVKTEKYNNVYLPRINAGPIVAPPGFSNATHLGATQLLARAK